MSAQRENVALGLELVRALREGDGCVPEADSDLNDASRRLVSAVEAEHGEAWLGRINRSREERSDPVAWRWDGQTVYNFGADFVLPRRDEELERLILERERAPYTSVRDDVPRVEAILRRVREVGGYVLVWS